MKYFIIDNFLDRDLCNKIINDFNEPNLAKKFLLIHGNRKFFSSSSLEFNDLISNSEHFKNLTDKLNSKEFLEMCLKKFDIEVNKFSLENFFKKQQIGKFHKIYKNGNNKSVGSLSATSLIKFALFKYSRFLIRKIKFSKFFYPNKKPVELLYDFSKAGNGYSREIHRDSDSRLIVFLLYLNELPENSERKGGNLDIYKLIQGPTKTVQPDKNNCEKIKSIKPEIGKLVVFLNDNESFHAVSEMKNHPGYRYFMYGGFTLLGQKNPYITNKSKLPTEFHIYD